MESFEESDPSINALKSSGKSPFADCPTSIKGVLLVDRRVLLVKNSRDEWELPGGRIDEGEDHAETLSREFAEELSIDVAMSTHIDSYLFEVIPGRHVFIVTYGCTLAGEFRPAISHEHTEHCLWPVERLFRAQASRGLQTLNREVGEYDPTRRCSQRQAAVRQG